jgi:hypothetical protein
LDQKISQVVALVVLFGVSEAVTEEMPKLSIVGLLIHPSPLAAVFLTYFL